MEKIYHDDNNFFIYDENENMRNISNRETSIITRDLNHIIDNLNPDYRDKFFYDEERCIFLERSYELSEDNLKGNIKGVTYIYSDRIYSWYSNNSIKESEKKACRFLYKTGNYFQEFLRNLYKNENLNLVQILVGINHSTLYAYNVFGFIE